MVFRINPVATSLALIGCTQFAHAAGFALMEQNVSGLGNAYAGAAAVQVLTPVFDAHFSESSFGFRPNRSAHQAVKKVLRLIQRGYAYAVDRNGLLVAHPDISMVLQKRDLSNLPQLRSALAAGAGSAPVEDVATIVRGLGGERVLTTYAAIAPLGWLVFVEQSVGEAFAPLQASIIRSVILFLAGLALSVLASVVFSRRMVTPIQMLQAGAAQIGAGALDQRIEVRTGDELEMLAGQFNIMAAQLQESYGQNRSGKRIL